MLKYIDLFGQNINLTLNHEKTIKTSFGGCLTILTVILIATSTLFIEKDIINKEQPISFTQKNISTV